MSKPYLHPDRHVGVTIDLHNQTEGFTITGGTGNDIIIGSSAADAIIGGPGNDTFRYINTAGSQPGTGKFDSITDFTHGADTLDLSAISAITKDAVLVNAAGQVAAHGISYYQSGSDTIVIANTHSTANQIDLEVHLIGVTASTLIATDFHHA